MSDGVFSQTKVWSSLSFLFCCIFLFIIIIILLLLFFFGGGGGGATISVPMSTKGSDTPTTRPETGLPV